VRGKTNLAFIFSLVFLFFLTGKVLPAEKPLFRFVHLSDIHFVDSGHLQQTPWKEMATRSTRKFDRMPEVLLRLADWVNKNQIDLVVITGDALENPGHAREAWPELVSLLGKMKTPFFNVPGNHDFGLEQVMPFSYGGPDFWFSYAGFIFAGFQTYTSRFSGMVELADRKSLEGLASVASDYPEQPVIVLTHAPLYSGPVIPTWAPPANAAQIRQVMQRCGNVFLALSGHIHVLTSGEEKGISYVTAPGLVETPDFSFLLWSVYPDRLEAVALSGVSFEPVPHSQKILVKIPERLRKSVKAPTEKPETKNWPESKELLTKWFGPEWSEYPGGTPIIWKKERLLLPKGSQDWFFIEQAADPLPDASGKNWYEPNYQAKQWRQGSLPAVFGYRRNKAAREVIGTKLETSGSSYWRKTFNVEAIPSGQRLMLRVASDKCAVIYLNGQLVDEERLFHWADYWNRYVVVPVSLLNPGENTLAVKLVNTTSSHGYLDIELTEEIPEK